MAATLEGIAEYHRDEARTIREHAWRTPNLDAKAVLLASAEWHADASTAILAVERAVKQPVAVSEMKAALEQAINYLNEHEERAGWPGTEPEWSFRCETRKLLERLEAK